MPGPQIFEDEWEKCLETIEGNYSSYIVAIVKRKTTVGAGDSMVAGIVYYISQKKNLEEALQYGVDATQPM